MILAVLVAPSNPSERLTKELAAPVSATGAAPQLVLLLVLLVPAVLKVATTCRIGVTQLMVGGQVHA